VIVDVLYIPNDFTPVDLLLFRKYGREVPGLLEQVYSINPGLAALGPFPPRGTSFNCNPPAPVSTVTTRPLVRLY
jgi:phage tail protein X